MGFLLLLALLGLFIRNGQLLATGRSARFQDFSAIFGSHARTKTMSFVAMADFWLIGSFSSHSIGNF